MRILVAEDDAALAEVVSQTLRQSGYAIDCVKNGQDADTALSTQEFDLLILDLGLPKLSGLDVLRRLRARGSLLPVLILTAADSIEQRVGGLDAGADDYMPKPFALSELEARVRALTRQVSSAEPCGATSRAQTSRRAPVPVSSTLSGAGSAVTVVIIAATTASTS